MHDVRMMKILTIFIAYRSYQLILSTTTSFMNVNDMKLSASCMFNEILYRFYTLTLHSNNLSFIYFFHFYLHSFCIQFFYLSGSEKSEKDTFFSLRIVLYKKKLNSQDSQMHEPKIWKYSCNWGIIAHVIISLVSEKKFKTKKEIFFIL